MNDYSKDLDWRDVTQGVFDTIKRVAEDQCNGDYKEAFEKCYEIFLWS